MKKSIITMAAMLCGAALTAQEVTDIVNTVKNENGEFVNKYSGMDGKLKLSKPFDTGYYCFSFETSTDYPALVWYSGSNKTASGGYEHYCASKVMQPKIYYFKVIDSKADNFRFGGSAYVKKGQKVHFSAKNTKLTALTGIPENIFPDFTKNLAALPDGENFLYFSNYSKTSQTKKITLDKTPAMQVIGLDSKEGNSVWATPSFPVTNAGTLTIKFSAKSTGGCKKLLMLVRDSFWKKGSASKRIMLTEEWQEYTWTIDCAKSYKQDIILACFDTRLGPGEYNFRDFSITYTK